MSYMTTTQTSNLISYKANTVNKSFDCDFCKRKFRDKAILIDHVKTCIEDRTCTSCDIVFKNNGSYFSHALFIHNKFEKLQPWSSLNKYFMCDYCSRKFHDKVKLIIHLENCITNRTCTWCDLVFETRGKLVTHTFYTHGEKSVKRQRNKSYECDACNKSFSIYARLKYHIRSKHFNLQNYEYMRDDKRVNDVWYEGVLNSDTIMQMKKTSEFSFVVQRYEGEEPVELLQKKLVDVRHLYPTYSSCATVKCDVCEEKVSKRDFKRHYQDKHSQHSNLQCNNCMRTFKRTSYYARHLCKVIKREPV